MCALLSVQVNTSLCDAVLFILNSSLLCPATCRLVQGQSTHLHFILEHRFPPVSGADLSANADEHVDSANTRSRPLLPLVQTWGIILASTVVFCWGFFIGGGGPGWKYVHTFYASHLSSISALSVIGWMQQFRRHTDLNKKELSSTNTPAYQYPYVIALRYEYIWEVFWILLAFLQSMLSCYLVAEKIWIITTGYLCNHILWMTYWPL